jgi:hypothetical protein
MGGAARVSTYKASKKVASFALVHSCRIVMPAGVKVCEGCGQQGGGALRICKGCGHTFEKKGDRLKREAAAAIALEEEEEEKAETEKDQDDEEQDAEQQPSILVPTCKLCHKAPKKGNYGFCAEHRGRQTDPAGAGASAVQADSSAQRGHKKQKTMAQGASTKPPPPTAGAGAGKPAAKAGDSPRKKATKICEGCGQAGGIATRKCKGCGRAFEKNKGGTKAEAGAASGTGKGKGKGKGKGTASGVAAGQAEQGSEPHPPASKRKRHDTPAAPAASAATTAAAAAAAADAVTTAAATGTPYPDDGEAFAALQPPPHAPSAGPSAAPRPATHSEREGFRGLVFSFSLVHLSPRKFAFYRRCAVEWVRAKRRAFPQVRDTL